MDEILQHPLPEQGGGKIGKEIIPPIEGEASAPAGSLRERLRRRWLQTDGAQVGRRLMTPLHFFAASAVIGVAAVVAAIYTPAYVVSVDGVPLGTIQNPQVFEEAAERVETRVSEILGHDYSLEWPVSYERVLVEKGSFPSRAAFEDYLFHNVDAVEKSYLLKVDGEVIGTAADRAALDDLLESIQAPYCNENTVSAKFLSNVTITSEYTPSDLNQDLEAMKETLTANVNGQTVYEVREGDTFMALAFANDMDMSELEALNPDVENVDNLYIGQLLHVKEEVPFLSVQTVDRVTYEEAIPCPVEEVEDDSMYQGDSKVLDPGVEGEALVTADVTYRNGREQERNVIATETVREPTTRVVAVGTQARPTWLPTGHFIWPVYGTITSQFGYRSIFGSTSKHGGIDIATSYGTSIKAADGGTVVWSGRGSGSYWSYGNYVVIDHGNGKQTYYAHCSSLLVSAGDKVYQGQTIARVGSTGRSTGNHCHFEVKLNGTSVNPLRYLP